LFISSSWGVAVASFPGAFAGYPPENCFLQNKYDNRGECYRKLLRHKMLQSFN
jgi:hypothetical protein